MVPSHFLISKIEKYRKFTTATILEKFQISNVVQKYVRECILSQKKNSTWPSLKKKKFGRDNTSKTTFLFLKKALKGIILS